jgi:4-hydroxy-tetrahydrodipicolinate synthase
VLDHLDQVVAAVAPLPVIVQFAPVQTGTALGVGAFVELAARHANLAAIKVEANPPGRVVTALAEKGVTSLVGYAGLHLPDALGRGASGVQPGCSFTEIYVELWRQWSAGDLAGFGDLHARLLRYLSSWMAHVEHIVQVEKTISAERGLISGDTCRRPGYRLDEFEAASIPRFLDDFAALLRPRADRR